MKKRNEHTYPIPSLILPTLYFFLKSKNHTVRLSFLPTAPKKWVVSLKETKNQQPSLVAQTCILPSHFAQLFTKSAA